MLYIKADQGVNYIGCELGILMFEAYIDDGGVFNIGYLEVFLKPVSR